VLPDTAKRLRHSRAVKGHVFPPSPILAAPVPLNGREHVSLHRPKFMRLDNSIRYQGRSRCSNFLAHRYRAAWSYPINLNTPRLSVAK
jgi:hypothetical protein